MNSVTKKSRPKKIKFYQLYHFFTDTTGALDIQGSFDEHCSETTFLYCPKNLVSDFLEIIDNCSGSKKLSNAIRKKLSIKKNNITISVSKVLGYFGGLNIDSVMIYASIIVNEDREYDESYKEHYCIERFENKS